MRFNKNDVVTLGFNSIPGTILNCIKAIPEFKIEAWYNVTWVDGCTSLHAESELFPISKTPAANEDIYETQSN